MSSYDVLVAADGALSHWPLDDTGSMALDIIAHVNDGTLRHGPTTGVSGPVSGQAAMGFPNIYPAASPYVLLANPTLIPRPPAAFSLEAWVQNTDPFNPAYYWVLSTGTPGASDSSAQIQLTLTSADVDDLWYYSNTAGVTANQGPLLDGAWHHIVFTYDGAGISVWYLDGAVVAVDRTDPLDGSGFPIATTTPADAVLAGNAGNVGIGGDVGVGNFTGNLAHVAVYPLALTPCRVLSHFELAMTGTYTACPEWVRLKHSSGQGYWQSNGPTTEQWAGGVRREVLPYPTMVPPAAFVLGKDPATGLGMWVDPPATTTSYPVAPVVVGPPIVGPGDACVRARCGAAVALQSKLVDDYNNWRQWINAAVGIAIGGVFAAFFVELIAILDAAEVAAWVGQVLGIIKPIMSTAGATALPSLLPALPAAEVDAILEAFFCALQCDSGLVSFGAAEQDAVTASILGNLGTFDIDLRRELLAELVHYEPLQDWQAAMSNASSSVLCDGITCP